MKIKTLAISAIVSLVVLLSALFTPLFCGMAFLGFPILINLSIWEYSHPLTFLCFTMMVAFTLVPLVRPTTKAWLFPFSFGLVVFAFVLCAAAYSFPLATDFSNVLFHPYGLILLGLGGLLCIIEGVAARWHLRSSVVV